MQSPPASAEAIRVSSLFPDVRPTRGSPEVEVGVDELLQTEMLGERGRQQQPRVGHQAVVVEGRFNPVEAMR